MTNSLHFQVDDKELFLQQVLKFSEAFKRVSLLDSNAYSQDKYSKYSCLIGLSNSSIKMDPTMDHFENLKELYQPGQWLFTILSYDLKEETDGIKSKNPSPQNCPRLVAFVPEILILEREGNWELQSNKENLEQVLAEIKASQSSFESNKQHSPQAITSKEDYVQNVKWVKERIVEGDFYELNYCHQFYEEGELESHQLFSKLNKTQKAPFSGYFRSAEHEVLCSSPERFMAKRGKTLISQPIKGTVSRGKDDSQDKELSEGLLNNEKERAENVMIVDLVRNDLNRVSKIGTVAVPELFGIYPFRNVIQMISTVTGEIKNDIHPVDSIRACFPMGSMTGAPKVMVMKTIEKLESQSREWYSGSMGYFDPEGDFDFNVIIRSILNNRATKRFCFTVGGAITFDSNPEAEYQETLIKAKGVMNALNPA